LVTLHTLYTHALKSWETSNNIPSHLKKLRYKRFQSLRFAFSAKHRHNTLPTIRRQTRPTRVRSSRPAADDMTGIVYSSSSSVDNLHILPQCVQIRLPSNFWIFCTSSYFRHGGINFYTHSLFFGFSREW